jgi:hypothetical protein
MGFLNSLERFSTFLFIPFPNHTFNICNMAFETDYQLEDVPATRVPSDEIDGTFRSTSIGESRLLYVTIKISVLDTFPYFHACCHTSSK